MKTYLVHWNFHDNHHVPDRCIIRARNSKAALHVLMQNIDDVEFSRIEVSFEEITEFE